MYKNFKRQYPTYGAICRSLILAGNGPNNLENNQKIPIYRLTIDRNEDLEFLRAIASNITKQPILMEDIYELFLQKPKILDLYNDGMNLNEGYNKSLKDDEEFLKK